MTTDLHELAAVYSAMSHDELIAALLQAAQCAEETEALIAELREQQDLLDTAVSSSDHALEVYDHALATAA